MSRLQGPFVGQMFILVWLNTPSHYVILRAVATKQKNDALIVQKEIIMRTIRDGVVDQCFFGNKKSHLFLKQIWATDVYKI